MKLALLYCIVQNVSKGNINKIILHVYMERENFDGKFAYAFPRQCFTLHMYNILLPDIFFRVFKPDTHKPDFVCLFS